MHISFHVIWKISPRNIEIDLDSSVLIHYYLAGVRLGACYHKHAATPAALCVGSGVPFSRPAFVISRWRAPEVADVDG